MNRRHAVLAFAGFLLALIPVAGHVGSGLALAGPPPGDIALMGEHADLVGVVEAKSTCARTDLGDAYSRDVGDEGSDLGGAPPGEGPDTLVCRSGAIYLGGNPIAPPYLLSMYHGLLVVNGLQLPILVETPPEISTGVRAQAALIESVDSIIDKARANGWRDVQILAEMRRRYSLSPLVSSVSVVADSAYLSLNFADGTHIVETLPPRDPSPRPSPSQVQRAQLLSIKQDLDSDRMVIIVSNTERVIVPVERVSQVVGVIKKLREHSSISDAEKSLLSDVARSQFQSPMHLRDVK